MADTSKTPDTDETPRTAAYFIGELEGELLAIAAEAGAVVQTCAGQSEQLAAALTRIATRARHAAGYSET